MGTGYIRQSSADIVDGNAIEASHFNNEFNAIQSAMNGVTGHAHDGTLGQGPKISLTGSVSGTLPITNGGTGLTAISTDQIIYGSASNLYSTTALTPFVRTILDDTDAATVRSTIGLGSIATQAASAVNITGGTISGVPANFTSGTITGITDLTVADGGTGASTASGARTNLGLGTIATQNANAVAITGGTITGITGPLSVTGDISSTGQISGGILAASDFYTNTITMSGDIAMAGHNINNSGNLAFASGKTITGGTHTNFNGGPVAEFRNQLINGDFRFWQRGTSQTSSAYGSDDRWLNQNVGTTKTHSQQVFPTGQTLVPGNPIFWSRTVVTSVAGAGNVCNKLQRMDDVRIHAGGTYTLTFYAKADASKNIAVEFSQGFGTGGSPSATVTGINVTTCALTTNWTRYDVLVTFPSILGMTLGTSGNSYTQVMFWFDAGSTSNSRTNSLGQQSGTFDIAHVSLVPGDARLETDPFSPRHVQQELALCQRYYQSIAIVIRYPATAAGQFGNAFVQLPVPMRISPTVGAASGGSSNNISGPVLSFTNNIYGRYEVSSVAAGDTYSLFISYPLDAEL